MNGLKMHTPDITRSNVEKLRTLFPDCIVESIDESGNPSMTVNFDLLKQHLTDAISEEPKERYCLTWPGKRASVVAANTPITKTLRPYRHESSNFNDTRNLFIEGDNLEALKLLQETYLNRVKMVYIDPPYNTGKDFIYKDSFASDQAEHETTSGERSSEGDRLVANPDGNGRFHSNWSSMIAPRIRLARNLLTQDGAIFVSCDEGEHPRLRLLMDEAFGQSNFVADMVWAAGRKNDSRLISVSHEYIVCYARDMEYLRNRRATWRQRKKGLDEIYTQYDRLKKALNNDFKAITEGMKEWYRNLPDNHPSKSHKHYSHVDARGIYFPDNISWPGGGGPKYQVLHPVTRKPVKIPSRGWVTSDQKKMQEWIDDNRVHFGEDENSVPCLKSYLSDRENQTPYSVFYQDGRAASKRLRALMDGDFFEFPKDELVIQELMEMLTGGDDIIVDFFAGSSTTAHSVMLQNAADGGNRRFIMVQLDEPTTKGSTAAIAGFRNIPEISRERIRRAGQKVLEEGKCHEGWNRDTGFRTLKIDSSNMSDVYYTPELTPHAKDTLFTDNIKPDRTPEDLLFQVMLDWGVDLSLPIATETIQGKEVFFVDGNALVACFDAAGGVDEDLVKALASREPLRVVFRDAGFKDSAAKINVEQVFKLLSPATDVRCI